MVYEKGNLIKGISRGNGYEGEDILENLKTIKNIPNKIVSDKVPKMMEIRCEIYIGKKTLIKSKIISQIQEMQLEVH